MKILDLARASWLFDKTEDIVIILSKKSFLKVVRNRTAHGNVNSIETPEEWYISNRVLYCDKNIILSYKGKNT